MHLATFKKELDRLVEIGVLRRAGATQWAAGTFIIPKKDGTVRWVSDFRQLNKYIERKQYPLPRIQDVVQRQRPYKFLTKIDISMQYYTFLLDEASQELCTIVTPFGKYHYCACPMGVNQSPDFAQATMEEVFHDLLDRITVYIDDIKITSNSWDEHIALVQEVLHRLDANGFTVNPLKCEWAVQETDFLGFWFTPNGVKPWDKKIQAILQLDAPTNRTQVRALCGSITFYRDMFPRRAHILAPITRLQSKDVPFEWTPDCQSALEQIKAVIAEGTLLAYPDPNHPFNIYTDASDFQLGAVIMQHNKPVAFYSRKLTPTQRKYTTIEKELLSVVETLKEFRSFLLGAPITIYTDHANLVHTVEHANDRILRWRLFIEDFHPTFVHLPGKTNTIADGLSRAPIVPWVKQETPSLTSFLAECLLFYPPQQPDDPVYPLDFELIAQRQQQDQSLAAARLKSPDLYQARPYPTSTGEVNLWCHRSTPQAHWKICLPNTLVTPATSWYHHLLGHAGVNRLYSSMSRHFTVPKLKEYCTQFVSQCAACQKYKLPGPGKGELPPKNLTTLPWDEVAVDLIGPWSFKAGNVTYEFFALTMIDPFTTLSEIVRIDNKDSRYIAYKFENEWLSRYPRPLRCIHDQGQEFTGAPFQLMLQANGIKDVPTTVKNPQANAVNERLHQTVQNILRTYLHTHDVSNPANAHLLVDACFATARHAVRSAIHRTLGSSPGAIVFNRDMFLPIPLLADLQALRQRRQQRVDYNLLQENLRRQFHDYQPGEQVLVVIEGIKSKLSPTTMGPFTITEVHTNGNVTIQRKPHVFERINIRRLRPYTA